MENNQIIIRYRGKKWGLLNQHQEIIADYLYDEIIRLTPYLFRVKRNHQYALINDKGVIMTPFYDDISYINEYWLRVRQDGLIGVVDMSGKILIPIEYDYIEPEYSWTSKGSSYITLHKNGKVGLADKTGQIIIPVIYEKLEDCTATIGLIKITHGGTGYVDAHNQIVIDLKYSEIQHITADYFMALKRDKWGIIDWQENILVDFQYSEMDFAVSENGILLIVKKNNQYALMKFERYLDKKQAQYRYDKPISAFMKQTISFIRQWDNQLITDKIVYLLGKEYDTRWRRREEGFLCARTGEIKIPPEKQIFDYWENHHAMILRNHRRGLCDDAGNIIVPPIYDWLYHFYCGLARARNDDKRYGFINQQGEEYIPFIYDKAFNFQEGLAAVCLNGKWGFIDTTGKVVVDLIYDKVESFYMNVAAVLENNQWHFIDKNGQFAPARIFG